MSKYSKGGGEASQEKPGMDARPKKDEQLIVTVPEGVNPNNAHSGQRSEYRYGQQPGLKSKDAGYVAPRMEGETPEAARQRIKGEFANRKAQAVAASATKHNFGDRGPGPMVTPQELEAGRARRKSMPQPAAPTSHHPDPEEMRYKHSEPQTFEAQQTRQTSSSAPPKLLETNKADKLRQNVMTPDSVDKLKKAEQARNSVPGPAASTSHHPDPEKMRYNHSKAQTFEEQQGRPQNLNPKPERYSTTSIGRENRNPQHGNLEAQQTSPRSSSAPPKLPGPRELKNKDSFSTTTQGSGKIDPPGHGGGGKSRSQQTTR